MSEISRCINLRNAIVVKTSWLVAITAAVANRHSKRIDKYTRVMRNDNRMAIMAPRLSSCPTRGPMPSLIGVSDGGATDVTRSSFWPLAEQLAPSLESLPSPACQACGRASVGACR